LNGFAEENKDKTVLAIGCGDSYVQLLSQNRDKLPDNVIAPYIDIDLMNSLIHKEKFYRLCEEAGLDYPRTFVHRRETGHDLSCPFSAVYIKPSSGIDTGSIHFPTQKKCNKAKDRTEHLDVLDNITLRL
jgi:D-aspartate ligase